MHRLFATLLVLTVATTHAGQTPDKSTHYRSNDLILGAVPQEIVPFREALGNPPAESLWGIPYFRGRIAGKPVVVAITGIGKTFTGMTSTLFIAELKPRLVLMSGTGARINPDLRTGDVIVATVTHEHDYGSLTREDMVYRPMNGPDNGNEVQNAFSPPASWLAIADRAIAEYKAPQVQANGSTYTIKARRGVVSSSDLFGVTQARIDTLRTRESLINSPFATIVASPTEAFQPVANLRRSGKSINQSFPRFHTNIMEMESAPLAHVCEALAVPCLIVRAGSNVAQEAPNDDYLRLGPIAAKEAARFSLHLLNYL